MTGTELWIIRDWLLEKTEDTGRDISESEGVIIDLLNDAIKENLLTTETYITSGETIADYVRKDTGKIQVIKTVCNIFGIGLKESKDLVDSQWDAWLEKVK